MHLAVQLRTKILYQGYNTWSSKLVTVSDILEIIYFIKMMKKCKLIRFFVVVVKRQKDHYQLDLLWDKSGSDFKKKSWKRHRPGKSEWKISSGRQLMMRKWASGDVYSRVVFAHEIWLAKLHLRNWRCHSTRNGFTLRIKCIEGDGGWVHIRITMKINRKNNPFGRLKGLYIRVSCMDFQSSSWLWCEAKECIIGIFYLKVLNNILKNKKKVNIKIFQFLSKWWNALLEACVINILRLGSAQFLIKLFHKDKIYVIKEGILLISGLLIKLMWY